MAARDRDIRGSEGTAAMRGGVWSACLILMLAAAPAGAEPAPDGGPGMTAERDGAGGRAFEAPWGRAPAEPSVAGDETFQGGFNCRAPASAAGSGPIVCQSRINPVLPDFLFSLRWYLDPETGERVVTGISIRREGRAEPFQVIAGLEARTAPEIADGGFEIIDMDFDGYLDMRLIAGGTAGPNMLYRNWLWVADSGRFVESAMLDEIVTPEFDPETREIVSRWRSSAAEGGVDVYTWDDGVPVMIHREVDRFDGPARCTRTFFDRIDDEMRETGSGACS